MTEPPADETEPPADDAPNPLDGHRPADMDDRKLPTLHVDPGDVDPVLVRDIRDHLEQRFDVQLDTATEHIRAWTVGR